MGSRTTSGEARRIAAVTRPHSRRTPFLSATLSLAVALGGCSQSASVTTVPLDASEVTIERALSLEALSRPVLESAEVAFVLRAESSLVERCMQAQGYDFEFPAQQADLVESPTLLTEVEVWARASVDRASEVGFELRSHLDEVRRAQASVGRIAESGSTGPIDLGSLSTEELALFDVAYFGAPSERVEIIERDGSVASIAGGGCLGQARAELCGDLGNYLRPVIDADRTNELRHREPRCPGGPVRLA